MASGTLQYIACHDTTWTPFYSILYMKLHTYIRLTRPFALLWCRLPQCRLQSPCTPSFSSTRVP